MISVILNDPTRAAARSPAPPLHPQAPPSPLTDASASTSTNGVDLVTRPTQHVIRADQDTARRSPIRDPAATARTRSRRVRAGTARNNEIPRAVLEHIARRARARVLRTRQESLRPIGRPRTALQSRRIRLQWQQRATAPSPRTPSRSSASTARSSVQASTRRYSTARHDARGTPSAQRRTTSWAPQLSRTSTNASFTPAPRLSAATFHGASRCSHSYRTAHVRPPRSRAHTRTRHWRAPLVRRAANRPCTTAECTSVTRALQSTSTGKQGEHEPRTQVRSVVPVRPVRQGPATALAASR